MTTSQENATTGSEFCKLTKIILDCDFLDDPKIIELEAEFGSDGVLAWQKLLCAMARETGSIIPKNICLIHLKRRGIANPEKLIQYLISAELIYFTDETNSWVFHPRLSAEQRSAASRQNRWRKNRAEWVARGERATVRSARTAVCTEARTAVCTAEEEQEEEHEHEQEEEQEKEEINNSLKKPKRKSRTAKTLENWKPPEGKLKIRDYVYLADGEREKLIDAFAAAGLDEEWLKRGFFKLENYFLQKPAMRHERKDDYRSMLNWVLPACIEEQTKLLNRDAAEARAKYAGGRR